MAQLLSAEDRLKRKKALKIKKSLDKEIDERNLRDVSSSENEEVDFSKVIRPIGYFIDDREQMIEEMFSILKGEQLRKMLPPLLKNYTLEELKADCLVHLLGMSKKRIFAILEGRDLNSSSDSETGSDNSSKESAKIDDTKFTNVANRSSVSDDDALSLSVSKKEMDFLTRDVAPSNPKHVNKKKSKQKTKIQVKQEPVCAIVISDSDSDDKKDRTRKNHSKEDKKTKTKKHKIHKKEGEKSVSEIVAKDIADVVDSSKIKESETRGKGKSLLEILELEMRARAIRALLKNTPNSDDLDPVSVVNIKSESNKISEDRVQLGKTIAEAIGSPLRNEEAECADVELIDNCDVDLCITLDDDDDDCCIQKEDSSPAVIDITSPSKNNESKESPSKNNESKESPVKSTSSKDTRENKTVSQESSRASPLAEPPKTGEVSSPVEDAVSSGDCSKDSASWSERWAESKNVKEIVKSSKIRANLRKRMRFARMLKQKQMRDDQPNSEVVVDFGDVEESSVAMYNLIKSLDKPKSGEEISEAKEADVNNSNENNDELEKKTDLVAIENEEVSEKEVNSISDSNNVVESECLIIENESGDSEQ